MQTISKDAVLSPRALSLSNERIFDKRQSVHSEESMNMTKVFPLIMESLYSETFPSFMTTPLVGNVTGVSSKLGMLLVVFINEHEHDSIVKNNNTIILPLA